MRYALAAFLMLAAPAFAADQPDPVFLQKAVVALQAQRNAALDAQAVAEARAAQLTDEVAALKKQIEDAKKSVEKKD